MSTLKTDTILIPSPRENDGNVILYSVVIETAGRWMQQLGVRHDIQNDSSRYVT